MDDFGGLEYLVILSEQYISISIKSLDFLCEKLTQAYTCCELYKLCKRQEEFLESDETEVLNPNELINSLEQRVADLNNKVEKVATAYKFGDDAERVLALRAEQPNTIPGLETGMPKFDYYTNGGQPGDLIMVCARAKTGKSTMLTNWATKLSVEDKIPILYIDTEMNEREQEDRILAILSGVPHKEIMSGMYVIDTENGTAEDKKRRLKEAIEKLKESEYYHIYMPTFTVDKVNAVAKSFKVKHGIEALFFDYLKFPASELGTLKSAQEWQMLGFIASGLKDLAGTLNIPVYSACQENRSNINEQKKDATNVGGSDRILQLATKLIFLVNKPDEVVADEGEYFGNQQLQIAYQRNGESNCPPINVFFNKPILKMKEV